MNKPRIALTGVTGFIGSHLLDKLHLLNFLVRFSIAQSSPLNKSLKVFKYQTWLIMMVLKMAYLVLT